MDTVRGTSYSEYIWMFVQSIFDMREVDPRSRKTMEEDTSLLCDRDLKEGIKTSAFGALTIFRPHGSTKIHGKWEVFRELLTKKMPVTQRKKNATR